MLRNNENITGIKINNKEFKLSQYADDTQIFLDGTEISLKETLRTLNIFYLMSGLKINVEKSKTVWIGSISHSASTLCKTHKLDWFQGPFKILGVNISSEVYTIWDLNAREIYAKMKIYASNGQKEN